MNIEDKIYKRQINRFLETLLKEDINRELIETIDYKNSYFQFRVNNNTWFVHKDIMTGNNYHKFRHVLDIRDIEEKRYINREITWYGDK